MGEPNPSSVPAFSAWQPLTFAGVAGLAMAPQWRFRLIRFVMAVFSTVCVTWFASVVFLQVMRHAIDRFPGSGSLRDGHLEWTGAQAIVLSQGTVLTVVMDPELTGEAGQVTDWQIAFGKNTIRFSSIFGYTSTPYPPTWSFTLSRDALEPWWGAWEPIIMAAIAGCSMLFFLIVWGAIGAVYGLFLRLYSYFLDRQIDFGACWRAGQTSLFSAALLLDAALLLYGHGRLDFLGLAFAFGLHFVIPWFYLLGAPLRFPPLYSKGRNPFAARE
jgi:hypothetical protein